MSIIIEAGRHRPKRIICGGVPQPGMIVATSPLLLRFAELVSQRISLLMTSASSFIIRDYRL